MSRREPPSDLADADTTGNPPYSELIEILAGLPLLVRETRRRLGLSQRAAAKEAGVLLSTISRCENGFGLHSESVMALLRWVGRPPQPMGLPAQQPETEADN